MHVLTFLFTIINVSESQEYTVTCIIKVTLSRNLYMYLAKSIQYLLTGLTYE